MAQRLVMVARVIVDSPLEAYAHAKRARDVAARVAIVREAFGLAAYAVGEWDQARSDLRAFARMTGSAEHLPVIADCERGLGHPEKALELAGSRDADRLDEAGRAEMRIVAAGARADMGQREAAVVTLKCPELNSKMKEPWVARLRYAYADALLAIGRERDGWRWMEKAAEADVEGWTDASERLDGLDQIILLDLEDGEDDEADEADQPATD